MPSSNSGECTQQSHLVHLVEKDVIRHDRPEDGNVAAAVGENLGEHLLHPGRNDHQVNGSPTDHGDVLRNVNQPPARGQGCT